MIVSGITGEDEYCLSVTNGDVSLDGAALGLERCGASAASGDGRDVFTLQTGGQLVNVAGGKCAIVRESNGEDGDVVLGNCDNAAEWEISGNAQLKLVGASNRCLSQRGLTAGTVDVAAKAAVTASSTANGFSHGAAMAVDGSPGTFWASKLDDTKGPIEFMIDFGEEQQLQFIEIDWEFPARGFAVSLSADGDHFNEAFATDANILKHFRSGLGSKLARKLRITMYEPDPMRAQLQGHLLYGIKSVSVFANRLQAIVTECSKAAKSTDARDKYFLVSAREYDPSAAKSLSAETPALEAAKATLASTVSELANVLPKLGACVGEAMATKAVASARTHNELQQIVSARTHMRSALGHFHDESDADVEEDLNALLAEARATIIKIRGALA